VLMLAREVGADRAGVKTMWLVADVLAVAAPEVFLVASPSLYPPPKDVMIQVALWPDAGQ
jgi:hypothetical protein